MTFHGTIIQLLCGRWSLSSAFSTARRGDSVRESHIGSGCQSLDVEVEAGFVARHRLLAFGTAKSRLFRSRVDDSDDETGAPCTEEWKGPGVDLGFVAYRLASFSAALEDARLILVLGPSLERTAVD